MLNDKQLNELRSSVGEIIQVSKGTRSMECVIVSYCDNDKDIRLNLDDDGYLILSKEQ